jgi:hypothetical protein
MVGRLVGVLSPQPFALSPIKIDLILVTPGLTSWLTTTGSLALYAYLVLKEPAAAAGSARFFDMRSQRLRPLRGNTARVRARGPVAQLVRAHA